MMTLTIPRFRKVWLAYPVVPLIGFLLVQLVLQKPVLVYTPGEWDCACGDLYIYTTRHVLWNPFRELAPERITNDFFSGLRENRCSADLDVCQSALPNHRVSGWRLAFREDAGRQVTLYFKLSKYGGGPGYELTGQGALTSERAGDNWSLTSYDAYF